MPQTNRPVTLCLGFFAVVTTKIAAFCDVTQWCAVKLRNFLKKFLLFYEVEDITGFRNSGNFLSDHTMPLT